MSTGDFNYNLYNTLGSGTNMHTHLPQGLMGPYTSTTPTTTWTQLNPPYFPTPPKGAQFVNGRLFIDGEQIMRVI